MGSISNTFIQRLATRLKQPLPGKDAQYFMAPESRIAREYISIEPKDPKLSSVLIALHEKNNEWVFPIIQRTKYNGAHSGQISLPGGKMEEIDRNLQDTAIRETKEEIGICDKGLKILGELTGIYVHASNFNILPVVAYLPVVQNYVPDKQEVVDVMEVGIKELLDQNRIKKTRLKLEQGISITAPYYDFHSKIVWGATAMILSEFSRVLRETLQLNPDGTYY